MVNLEDLPYDILIYLDQKFIAGQQYIATFIDHREPFFYVDDYYNIRLASRVFGALPVPDHLVKSLFVHALGKGDSSLCASLVTREAMTTAWENGTFLDWPEVGCKMDTFRQLLPIIHSSVPWLDCSVVVAGLLFLAAKHGNQKMVRYLLRYWDMSLLAVYQAFLYAIEGNNDEIVRMILHMRPHLDPGAHENIAIQSAAYKGRAGLIAILLTHPKVDPRVDDNYPLRITASNGDWDAFEMLLNHPLVDPSARHNEALEHAMRQGATEMVDRILAHPRFVEVGSEAILSPKVPDSP